MYRGYNSRSGTSYSSVRRRIVNSVANTMQLLENISVDVERGTSAEVFSNTSNNDSMP